MEVNGGVAGCGLLSSKTKSEFIKYFIVRNNKVTTKTKKVELIE